MFGFDQAVRQTSSCPAKAGEPKIRKHLSPLLVDGEDYNLCLTFLPLVGDPDHPETSKVTEKTRSHRHVSREGKVNPRNLPTPYVLDARSESKQPRTPRRGRNPSSRNSYFGSSVGEDVADGERFRPGIEYCDSSKFEDVIPHLELLNFKKASAVDSSQNTDARVIEDKLEWAITTTPGVFWRSFNLNMQNKDDWRAFNVVCQASLSLAKELTMNVMRPTDNLSSHSFSFHGCPIDAFEFVCGHISGILMSDSERTKLDTTRIDSIFDAFYTCGFKAMNCIREDEDGIQNPGSNDLEECEICGEGICVCSKIVTLFQYANRALQSIRLMEELAVPIVYSVISREIAQKVEHVCAGKYETSHLDDLTEWLKCKVLPWTEIVYPNSNNELSSKIRYEEFSQLLLEIYGKAIIKEMFSILIEFPDSQPILEDFRICMHSANLRNLLVTKLKWDLERRLLNAGVSTNSVLDAYCNCVRTLKFLDSSGILVQLITPPVREYLKQREETVRVILVSLTDESGDLADELSRNPTYSERSTRLCCHTWNEWMPDPIDVPRDKFNLRKSDLIQALVSIYGSKSLFIDEYRALLADRLLRMSRPGPITHEIKCLELLKLRFGDANLQKCEVMLKDVADSQRLNTRFYEDDGAVLADEDFVATGLIVSAQFWPQFKREALKLPEFIVKAFEKYTKAFEAIKGNRTLEWQHSVGTVEVELEHNSTVLQFTCTPTQASIIYHFSEQDTWDETSLSALLGISTTALQSRISFWISKGILAETSKGTYRISDAFGECSIGAQQNPTKFSDEGEADFPITSTLKQREDELQMFWSYIEGMLTNLESLPLARIHSMLKLFATIECSTEALQKFLDEKVSQNLLSYSGGQYQLPK